MRYWRQVFVTLISLAIIAGVVFAAVAIYRVSELPVDAYASDWTATFIIEHLKTSDNQWPTSWADLRDEYDRLPDCYRSWSFTHFQERVQIRFDLTSDQVRDAEPPLEAIRLTSGRRVSYDGDPNVNVRKYLRTGVGGMESLRD